VLRRAVILLFVCLMAVSTAFAECPRPYSTDNLLADLLATEEFLRNSDDAAAKVSAGQMRDGLDCLPEVLPPTIVGRLYRAVGGGLYMGGGDKDQALLWFRTASEHEQSFDYGLQDLPAGHILRGVNIRSRDDSGGDRVPIEGMAFVEGKHYLDGRENKSPKARLKRPHLYQYLVDGKVLSYLIDGNAFPSHVLISEEAVADATPKETTPRKPKRNKRGGKSKTVVVAPTPEPVEELIEPPIVEPEPVPEPIVAPEPAVAPEPIVRPEPAPVVEVEPEPIVVPEPTPAAPEDPMELTFVKPSEDEVTLEDLAAINFAPSTSADATVEEIHEDFVGERVRVLPVVEDTQTEEEKEVAAAEKVPKEKKPKKRRLGPPPTINPDGSLTVQRQFPREKIPLVAGGGAAVLTAGVIYYMSSVSRKKFNNGASVSDLDKYQANTNRLVLISAGVFAAGAGTLTWGIMLDGGAATPTFHVRF
jgi:hypothetical protein